MKRLIFLFALGLSCSSLNSCSEVSDFVQNKNGSRRFSTSNPVFDKYIARFEELGRIYQKNPYFQVGDIPVNFGDTENPLYDGVCFTYSNGKKEIIIKKSWWDRHEKKDPDGEGKNEEPDKGKKNENEGEEKYQKGDYSLIQESLLFHELGHCRLDRQHEEGLLDFDEEKPIDDVKKSMMSHNIITSNNYRKYKEGYWVELFTGSTEKLESLVKP